MKRSSLAWYVAVACLGGSLYVGSVVQADSPTTVKANPVVPTAMVAQAQSTQSISSTAATNTVANTVVANSELVIIDRLHTFITYTSFYKNSLILSTAVL